jgi:prepilin-type N-terminal cleavage/methylation domain-containing protein/prepilin-type processing-associated H-X9-DG protein
MRRRAFTLVELLVVMAILAILLAMLLSAIHKAREAASCAQCRHQMKEIALAVHHFAENNGNRFPRARGTFWTWWKGWPYYILPYLEQADLYQMLETKYVSRDSWPDAWKDPLNNTVIPIFLCPSDPRDLANGFTGSVGDAHGSFGFISYRGSQGTSNETDVPANGIFDPDQVVGHRLAEVTDGLSNTLMLGECPPSFDGQWGWWSGSDYDTILGTQLCPTVEYRGCPSNQPFRVGSINEPCDMLHFWSVHPNGANWAMADGSVRWMAYDNGEVTIPLSTRAGGEVVNLDP